MTVAPYGPACGSQPPNHRDCSRRPGRLKWEDHHHHHQMHQGAGAVAGFSDHSSGSLMYPHHLKPAPPGSAEDELHLSGLGLMKDRSETTAMTFNESKSWAENSNTSFGVSLLHDSHHQHQQQQQHYHQQHQHQYLHEFGGSSRSTSYSNNTASDSRFMTDLGVASNHSANSRDRPLQLPKRSDHGHEDHSRRHSLQGDDHDGWGSDDSAQPTVRCGTTRHSHNSSSGGSSRRGGSRGHGHQDRMRWPSEEDDGEYGYDYDYDGARRQRQYEQDEWGYYHQGRPDEYHRGRGQSGRRRYHQDEPPPMRHYEEEGPRGYYDTQEARTRRYYDGRESRRHHGEEARRYEYHEDPEPRYHQHSEPRRHHEDQPRRYYEDEEPRRFYKDQEPRRFHEDHEPRRHHDHESRRYWGGDHETRRYHDDHQSRYYHDDLEPSDRHYGYYEQPRGSRDAPRRYRDEDQRRDHQHDQHVRGHRDQGQSRRRDHDVCRYEDSERRQEERTRRNVRRELDQHLGTRYGGEASEFERRGSRHDDCSRGEGSPRKEPRQPEPEPEPSHVRRLSILEECSDVPVQNTSTADQQEPSQSHGLSGDAVIKDRHPPRPGAYQEQGGRRGNLKDDSSGSRRLPGAFHEQSSPALKQLKDDIKADIPKKPSRTISEVEDPAKPDEPDSIFIEVFPGASEKLRRAKETEEAVASDFYTPATCFTCSKDLFCISDVKYFICPDCRCVSLLDDSSNGIKDRQGVGIAFGYQTLFKMQEKIARSSKK